MPDEPAAPRRNSLDDKDLKRPRKRPAVMADQTGSPVAHAQSANEDDDVRPSALEPLALTSTSDDTDTTMDNEEDPDRCPSVASSTTGGGRDHTIELRAAPSPEPKRVDTSPQDGALSTSNSSQTARATPPEEPQQADRTSMRDHTAPTSPRSYTREYLESELESGLAPTEAFKEMGRKLLAQAQTPPSASANNCLWRAIIKAVKPVLERTNRFDASFYETGGLDAMVDFFGICSQLTVSSLRSQIEFLENASNDAAIALHVLHLEHLLQIYSNCNLLVHWEAGQGGSREEFVIRVTERYLDANTGILSLLPSFTKALFEGIRYHKEFYTLISHFGDVCTSLCRLLDATLAEADEVRIRLIQTISDLVDESQAGLLDVLRAGTLGFTFIDLMKMVDQLGGITRYLYSGWPNHSSLSAKLDERAPDHTTSSINNRREQLAFLAELVFRIPIYVQMLSCGRMEFRIRGLTWVSDRLVNTWKDWTRLYPWKESRAVSYLINYVIEKKVVQYVMGPDSHIELIRRCCNIPSLLTISGTITGEIWDAMWQPVADNKDIITVEAILQALTEMAQNVPPDMLEDICPRINCDLLVKVGLPLRKFVCEVNYFIRSTVTKTGAFAPKQPFRMLIDIIHGSSDQKNSSNIESRNVFDYAWRELRCLAEYGPNEEDRRQIFKECIQDIQAMNSKVYGSTAVLLALLGKTPQAEHGKVGLLVPAEFESDLHQFHGRTLQTDMGFLVTHNELPILIIKELEAFVPANYNSKRPTLCAEIRTRLHLLGLLLSNSACQIHEDFQALLWSAIVGNEELGSSERDVGFSFYSSLTRSEANIVLEKAFTVHLPTLREYLFSPAALHFCMNSIIYLAEHGNDIEMDENSPIEFSGINQLWRIILYTPYDVLADLASSDLINLYLDHKLVTKNPLPRLKATHAALVDCCVSVLGESLEVNSTAIAHTHRALDVLTRLIDGYRNRPSYSIDDYILEAGTGSSAADTQPSGHPMRIRLRWQSHNGAQSPVTFISIGSEKTYRELHWRVSGIVGSNRHRMVWQGRELQLSELHNKTIGELGLDDESMMQVMSYPNVTEDSARPNVNFLQNEILRHFDEFYNLLSAAEPMSSHTWDFLKQFPASEKIGRLVESQSTCAEIFPADLPHKSLYSLFALKQFYEKQTEDDTVNEVPFVQSALNQLQVLLNQCRSIIPQMSASVFVEVAGLLLDCLRMFLQGPSAQKIELGNVPEFVNSLDFLLRHLTTIECKGVEESIVNGVYVLIEACRLNTAVWLEIVNSTKLRDFIKHFLIQDHRDSVRQNTAAALALLCTVQQESELSNTDCYSSAVWDVLTEIVTDGKGGALDPQRSESLFATTEHLFAYLSRKPGALDSRLLFAAWFERLEEHDFSENVSSPEHDYVIIGYTSLLRRVVQLARENGDEIESVHLESVWERLLFPRLSSEEELVDAMDTDLAEERVPCLADPIRAELYLLYCELAEEERFRTRLLAMNMKLYPSEVYVHDAYNLDRRRWLRSPTGLVGLHNLSNTCYLNSLLTQLFMNRSFRSFFLRLQVSSTDEDRQTSYQLKLLFARMELGFSKAVEPRGLVDTLTIDGEAIDPNIQMDVDEFFGLVFDRLEREMPTPELKSAFQMYYSGQTTAQVRSLECAHISMRMEPFNSLKCDIKGKSTLEESLQAQVEGEYLLADNKYRCTTCNELVQAITRTCLHVVPGNLILHLKRFDYDLTLCNRNKINDFFEFPTVLDTAPYTLDYLQKKEKGEDVSEIHDNFELVGVLVHQGTAESGHYYSFVRNRLSRSPTPEWVEFNDSEVSMFNAENIANACYGGPEAATSHSYKNFSAYMLFYQRSPTVESGHAGAYNSGPVTLSQSLRLDILHDNEELLRKYCMYSDDYITFVKHLIELDVSQLGQQPQPSESEEPRESSRATVNLALAFYEYIGCRLKLDFRMHWDDAVLACSNYLLQSIGNCYTFLQYLSQRDLLCNAIVLCPWARNRIFFVDMVMKALEKLKNARPDLYLKIDREGEIANANPSVFLPICRRFAHNWYSLLYGVRSWNEFFQCLLRMARMGEEEIEALLASEILERCFETVLVEVLPPKRRTLRGIDGLLRVWHKTRLPVEAFIELMATLLDKCSVYPDPVPSTRHREPVLIGKDLLYPLTKIERECFAYKQSNVAGCYFFAKLLGIPTVTPGSTESLRRITAQCVTQCPNPDHPILTNLLTALLESISIEPANLAKPGLDCISTFLKHTRYEPYVQHAISKISDEVRTIATNGGQEHLTFFYELHTDAENNPPVAALPTVLNLIGQWAPPLLVFNDEPVRSATEEFLDILLLEPGAQSHNRDKHLEPLCKGIFDWVHEEVVRQTGLLDENHFVAMFNVLDKVQYFADADDQIRTSIIELKYFTDKLISEQDEAEIGSEDWNVSDMGSDADVLKME